MAPKKQAAEKEEKGDPIQEQEGPEYEVGEILPTDGLMVPSQIPTEAEGPSTDSFILPGKPLKKGASDIQGRFMVLMATRQDHLVDWVMSFPNMPNLKSDEYSPSQQALAAAILIHEYGTVAYLDWRLMLDRERR